MGFVLNWVSWFLPFDSSCLFALACVLRSRNFKGLVGISSWFDAAAFVFGFLAKGVSCWGVADYGAHWTAMQANAGFGRSGFALIQRFGFRLLADVWAVMVALLRGAGEGLGCFRGMFSGRGFVHGRGIFFFEGRIVFFEIGPGFAGEVQEGCVFFRLLLDEKADFGFLEVELVVFRDFGVFLFYHDF